MRNKALKLASLILVFVFLITSFSVSASAEGVEFLYTLEVEEYRNPLTADLETKESAELRFESNKYYGEDFSGLCVSDNSIIADNLRAVMVSRGANLDAYYKTKTQLTQSGLQQAFDSWIEEALKETENPEEGDYLRWVFQSISCDSVIVLRGTNMYYYHFPLKIVYYTTKAQEKAFDAKMESVIEDFNFDSDDGALYKSNVIYDYITDNVVYDYENLEDDSHLLKYTAYAALVNGVAVCQGYATLYYRLARECGLETRVVVGKSYGENHAWNIVKIGSYYYYLDSTWDAGMAEYDYYLIGSTQFTEDHTPDPDYLTSDFMRQYPISTTNFVFEDNHKHRFYNYIFNNDATCQNNGTETASCEYGCGATDTRVVPNSVANHKYTDSNDVTCDFGCGYVRVLGAKLVEEYGEFYYYLNEEKQYVTELVKIDGVWYYIQEGRWASEIDTLHKINGKWFLVQKGIWKAQTAIVKYQGKYFYVYAGKWDSTVNDLKKVDGKWYFIKSGKWDSSLESLHKLNGKWFLVKGGMWKATTGLVKYQGKQFYVVGGKWESRTGIYTISGKNYYISGGKWDKTKTTLYKKGSKLFAIKKGMWYKSKTIITYGGKRYYCDKGYAQLSFSGKVKIGTKTYTIKKGVVTTKPSITIQAPLIG